MSAHTISVRCQNCGSALQVSEGLRFITCAYCKSELEIKRDASTIHSEVLSAIRKNTENTVNQLKVIELQNELARLDREWDRWKADRFPPGPKGESTEPGEPIGSKAYAIAAALVFVVVATLGMIGNEVLAMVTVGLVGGLVILGWGHLRESDARYFSYAIRRYSSQRVALLRQLNEAQRRASQAGDTVPHSAP